MLGCKFGRCHEYGEVPIQIVFHCIGHSTCITREPRLCSCSSFIIQKNGSWPKLTCSGISSMVACTKLLCKWNTTLGINYYCMTVTVVPMKHVTMLPIKEGLLLRQTLCAFVVTIGSEWFYIVWLLWEIFLVHIEPYINGLHHHVQLTHQELKNYDVPGLILLFNLEGKVGLKGRDIDANRAGPNASPTVQIAERDYLLCRK